MGGAERNQIGGGGGQFDSRSEVLLVAARVLRRNSGVGLPRGSVTVQIGDQMRDRGSELGRLAASGTIDDEELPGSCWPVPKRLRDLIDSAKHYAPPVSYQTGKTRCRCVDG